MSEDNEDRKPLIDMVRKVESDLKSAGLEFLVGELAKVRLANEDLEHRLKNTTSIGNALHAKITEMAKDHAETTEQLNRSIEDYRARTQTLLADLDRITEERNRYRDEVAELKAKVPAPKPAAKKKSTRTAQTKREPATTRS